MNTNPLAAPARQRKPRTKAASPMRRASPLVCRDGDWWLLGRHRVVCGDLAGAAVGLLCGEEDALVVLAATPAAAEGVIRSWQERTGSTARHAASGREFGEPPTDTNPEPDHG